VRPYVTVLLSKNICVVIFVLLAFGSLLAVLLDTPWDSIVTSYGMNDVGSVLGQGFGNFVFTLASRMTLELVHPPSQQAACGASAMRNSINLNINSVLSAG
jgi:hypothetical protein